MSRMITNYLTYIGKASDMDEIARLTGVYLNRNNLLDRFQIIKHRVHPRPYRLLFSAPEENTTLDWIDSFSACPRAELLNRSVSFENASYIFVPVYPEREEGYLIRIDGNGDTTDLDEIISAWKNCNTLAANLQKQTTTKFVEEQGNLISQLVHDVQAIILLNESVQQPDELRNRLRYQRKVNQNITTFVRDTELLKIPVSIKDMIRSALELLGENRELVKILSVPSDTTIELDTELFARAFNEVVKNAIFHNKDRKVEIQVNIGREHSISPLLHLNWIKISITDNGKGIPPDFLPMVKAPFFTTRKQDGAAGFGLALADKIINAHSGYLEIDSTPERGARVTIYLPESE